MKRRHFSAILYTLEVERRSAARSKLLHMLRQFDKTPPAAPASDALTETNEDLLEDDSNLSAVEKL